MSVVIQNRQLAAMRKKEILRLAKAGSPRPSGPLGIALKKYITQSSTSFDIIFTAKLLGVAPKSWFRREAGKKKSKLLSLAKAGKSRPGQYSVLGRALRYYTTGGHSAYDAEFTAKILEVAPYWFRRGLGK